MYVSIQQLHSYWAYLTLALLVAAIFNGIIGAAVKKDFKPAHRKVALFALITTHVQAVAGLVLYFISPIVQTALSDFGSAMKNSELRLFSMEHPMMMVIGIILITIGFKKSKTAVSGAKQHKQIAIYYTIGLAFILSRIPYSVWF